MLLKHGQQWCPAVNQSPGEQTQQGCVLCVKAMDTLLEGANIPPASGLLWGFHWQPQVHCQPPAGPRLSCNILMLPRCCKAARQ